MWVRKWSIDAIEWVLECSSVQSLLALIVLSCTNFRRMHHYINMELVIIYLIYSVLQRNGITSRRICVEQIMARILLDPRTSVHPPCGLCVVWPFHVSKHDTNTVKISRDSRNTWSSITHVCQAQEMFDIRWMRAISLFILIHETHVVKNSYLVYRCLKSLRE